MNIGNIRNISNPYYAVNFKRKSKNAESNGSQKDSIKTADDIVRRVNNEFPAYKPTYSYETWKILNEANSEEAKKRKEDFFIKYYNQILEFRKEYSDRVEEPEEYCERLCTAVKDSKLANCYEMGQIVMGVLSANGYSDIYKTNLYYKLQFLDKDGYSFATHSGKIDHTCTTVKQEKDENNFKNSIIVDGWLNKAMRRDEAKDEYLKIFILGKEDGFFEEALKDFPKESKIAAKIKEAIADKRYNFSIGFVDNKYCTNKDREKIAQKIKELYPQLIFNEENN